MLPWYSNLCRSIFTRIFSLLYITGYGGIYEVCSISRSQAEVVDNTNILVQRRAVMTARTFYQRGQCLNLRSYTLLKLSLLFPLAPALKREVFLRLLSFFILLRNQICTNSNSVQNAGYLGCATSFFYLFQLVLANKKCFFSLANILLKHSTTLQCPFCLLASYVPFSYSLNRLRQAFEIAETK